MIDAQAEVVHRAHDAKFSIVAVKTMNDFDIV
jgi:hypothetical protein